MNPVLKAALAIRRMSVKQLATRMRITTQSMYRKLEDPGGMQMREFRRLIKTLNLTESEAREVFDCDSV